MDKHVDGQQACMHLMLISKYKMLIMYELRQNEDLIYVNKYAAFLTKAKIKPHLLNVMMILSSLIPSGWET